MFKIPICYLSNENSSSLVFSIIKPNPPSFKTFSSPWATLLTWLDRVFEFLPSWIFFHILLWTGVCEVYYLKRNRILISHLIRYLKYKRQQTKMHFCILLFVVCCNLISDSTPWEGRNFKSNYNFMTESKCSSLEKMHFISLYFASTVQHSCILRNTFDYVSRLYVNQIFSQVIFHEM